MSKLSKRITAMLLSGMLVIGSAPCSVFAASTDVDPGQTSEIAEEMFTEDTSEELVAGGETSEIEETSEAPASTGDLAEDASAEESQYYTVTLDANGGYFENEWDDSIGDYAQQAEVVEKHIPVDGTVAAIPVFTDQEGQAMLFAGWSLERDGELVSQAEEGYVPVDSCVLYAVWQAEDVAIGEIGEQEVADEGTEQADSVQELEEVYAAEGSADAVTSEENPVEEDEVTDFTEDTSDVPADAGETTESEDISGASASTGDITEEASGEEAEEVQYYTVTLDANGGYFQNEWDYAIEDYVQQAEVIEKHIPIDGAVAALPVFIDPDDQTMVFAGWSLERDGELVAQAEEAYIPVDNCVLYAVWQAEDATLGETGNQEVFEENTEQFNAVQESGEVEFASEGAKTAEKSSVEEDVVSEVNADSEEKNEQAVVSDQESVYEDDNNEDDTNIERISEYPSITATAEEETQADLHESLEDEESIREDAAKGIVDCGTCGANLTWSLDEEGTLTVSGNGKIPDRVIGSTSGYMHYKNDIKKVVIEEGVTSIGEWAFDRCRNLTSITVPGTLTSISYIAFDGCMNLKEVHVTNWESWLRASKPSINRISCDWYYKEELITDVVIPDGVTSIEDGSFQGCNSLTSITIPNSVTSIGSRAFWGCLNLSSIKIPKGVTSISTSTFNGCASLTNIWIPNSVTSIETYAFYLCDNLKDVYFDGSEEQWESIFIGDINEPLHNAEIHYNCGFSISLNEEEQTQYYTGSEIKPVPVVKNADGMALKKDTDYTLTYSNNIEPGTATITATGLGDYAGQTANVTFEIKKEISVDIDESEIIALPNQEILITARIISPNVTDISSNIKWGVSSSDDYEGITGSDSVTKVNERTYNVTHSETFKNTGVFTVSLEFLGVSDEVKIKVVVPDISVEMGPYFNDGSLVYEKITTINSFCDIRLVASFEKKNISEPDLIREYLSNVTYDIRNQDGSENNYVVIYSRKIEIKDDEKEGALILRIGPGKAVVKDSKDEKITFTDQANTVFEKEFQIRDGLLYYLKYRADNQDEEGNKYSYNNEHMFYYSDAFFYKGAATYNNDLAVMTLGLEMSSFSSPFYDHKYGEFTIGTDRAENILDAYTKLGFYPDSPREYNYNIELSNSSDKVAYTIATKYIASQETDDTLITVIVRGGGYGAEWASNFNVGETGDEKGFRTAANYVYDSVEDYIFQLKEEDKLIGDVKLLITGFSRGAAVANLVSHQINSSGVLSGCDIHSTNNYTYTFATPAGHYGKDTSDQNIFNILSENDLVPKIPFEDWGFYRYGKDVVLPESTPEEVKQSFYNYTGIVFNANKEKAFEGWLTDTILKISPDRSSYVNNLQYYITKWEELQYKDIKGDFVKGLLGGIINAFAEKYSLIDSSGEHLSLDVRSSANEIKALLGNSISIGKEAGDSILKCIDALSDEEMVIDMQLVHYPEHYLAWLETGGIYTADKNTYAKYSDEKKTIIGNGISGIIGNALHKPSYKSAVVAGTTNVSVFDSDGNLLVSTVSGIKSNGGAFAFSNSDEENSFVIIPSDVQISLVVGNGTTGKIDLCIKENTESENARTLIYEDIVIDEDTSVTILFDKGFSSVGDSSFVMKNGTAIEPIFDYRSTDDGEALIKSGTCNDSITWMLHENGLLTIIGTGEIPDYSWNGTGAVTSSTDAPWYQYSSLIKKVVVADDVTSIGDRAFARCDHINSVSIGCNVGRIGEAAFLGCTGLEIVSYSGLADALSEIGPNCFYDCISLKDIVIPESVTKIKEGVFFNCTNLTKMVIPDGVTVIESEAFQDCAGLSSVEMSNGVISIGVSAFRNCKNLKRLIVPTSVKTIAQAAFQGCENLESIEIPDGIKTISQNAFKDCSSLTSITVPDGITKISTGLFSGCSNLDTVILPSSLTEIGLLSFRGCSKLEEIIIPSNVQDIKNSAFIGCDGMISISIPSEIAYIGKTVFKDCANLSSVILRGRIGKICEGAFTECTYLKDIYYAGTEDDWSKIIIEKGNDPLSNARIHYNLDLSDSPVLLEKDSFVFDGAAKKPAVEIVGLKEGQDYTVRYENNTDVGVGVVIASGLDDFEGEARTTFEISPASIKEALVTGLKGKTYTGKALTQTPVVKIGSTTLEADTDYTVSYNNNTNVGTATVTITGKGNYSGTKTATFKINKATQSITASNLSLTFPSSGKITASGNKGSLSYKSSNTAIATVDSTGKVTAKGAGKATIMITAAATSNYNAATKTITVTIAKAAQSITAKAGASSVAVGKTTTVSITGAKGTKSYKSSDMTIATADSKTGKVTAKKVGTVKITATSAATANYKAASKAVTIKVVPAATASLTAANQATGIKLTWKKVTGANGYKVYRGSTLIKTITSGSTVTYADTKANTNGTKYTYKVVAKTTTGDSTLSKSRAIYRVARPTITSLKNSASKKMTVKWGKNAKANGYQIQYSTSKSFASGNKTTTITGASTVSKVIGSLTKGKTYYVRIRTYKTVGSTKYWSTWSASKSVKISK